MRLATILMYWTFFVKESRCWPMRWADFRRRYNTLLMESAKCSWAEKMTSVTDVLMADHCAPSMAGRLTPTKGHLLLMLTLLSVERFHRLSSRWPSFEHTGFLPLASHPPQPFPSILLPLSSPVYVNQLYDVTVVVIIFFDFSLGSIDPDG